MNVSGWNYDWNSTNDYLTVPDSRDWDWDMSIPYEWSSTTASISSTDIKSTPSIPKYKTINIIKEEESISHIC